MRARIDSVMLLSVALVTTAVDDDPDLLESGRETADDDNDEGRGER